MNKREISSERRDLANRLRQIREDAGYTQERFAELMEISLSAYKKIESGENQMTLDGLRRLGRKLEISADYLLYGTNSDLDRTWKMIQNCTEPHKLFLMLRLFDYFSNTKGQGFSEKKSFNQYDDKILQVMSLLDDKEGKMAGLDKDMRDYEAKCVNR